MSAHRIATDLFNAAQGLDPGSAGSIVVDRSPLVVGLVSAGAEARTLPRPTKVGLSCFIWMKTDGGDITLTVTGGYNEDGDTTFTFDDPGEFIELRSGYDGTNYYWRKTSDHATAILSQTEAGYLEDVTAGTIAASKALVIGSGSDLAGTYTYNSRRPWTIAYANAAASTAIASTSAETAFDTQYTLPANTLAAGTVLKIRCWATGTTVVGSDTVALKLYIGNLAGTALITSAATTMVNGHTWLAECQLHCRTAGTTGTAVSVGTYKVNSAEGTMTVKDDVVASFTINTQAAQLITASATFNTTNANSIRMDIFSVEVG